MRITITWSKLHALGSNTQTFDLERTLTIGRNATNAIVLNDRGVSRQHAYISVQNEQVFLTDISTNGTWVHAQAIKKCRLKRKMRFQIMEFSFVVEAIEMPAAHQSVEDNPTPKAVKPAKDLAEIVSKQPFIENLLDLIPDKEEG